MQSTAAIATMDVASIASFCLPARYEVDFLLRFFCSKRVDEALMLPIAREEPSS
jgi:hypothetical protein